ncbi:MAG: O-antigen ligase family protein, partial [Rubripirellula sp.]|nr:O-antigen ligase family protein [Rubripirellula sp.]
GDPFGPFVNNNNASGFLCLAIGCTLGLMVLVEQLFSSRRARGADGRNGNSSVLVIARLAAAAVLVTLVAGVAASNSRGGFLGLLAGSLVVLPCLLPRFSKMKLGLGLVGVISFSWLVISSLDFGTRSQNRFETLLDKRIMEDPRLDHWSDALVAAVHYLPFGSGLGTYRYACLPFQENGAPLWFVNADGMHIEWLVEGGSWLLPLVAFGLITLLRHVVWIRRGLKRVEGSDVELSISAASTVAYVKCIWVVALFCIPALLVTQCFDFGITLMPLLLTFACICGAILRASVMIAELKGDATSSSVGKEVLQSKSRRGGAKFASIGQTRGFRICRQISGPVALLVMTIALGIAAKELYVASVAQDEMISLRRERKQQLLVDMPALAGRLVLMQDLASANPRNAMVWKTLGELRLAEQQRLGAEQLFQLQPATIESHASWLSTKTLRHAVYSGEQPVSFQECLLPRQDAAEYIEARNDFRKALLLNPLDPLVRLSLLELDMVAPGASVPSAKLLLQAARLRPRSDSFLRYLLRLAADHPGTEGMSEIEAMREILRDERLREASEVVASP